MLFDCLKESGATNYLVFYQESTMFNIFSKCLSAYLQDLIQRCPSWHLQLFEGQIISLDHLLEIVKVNITIAYSFMEGFLSFVRN